MIALITDFGYRDYFVGVLKGIIRKINPEVEIVDIISDLLYCQYRAISCKTYGVLGKSQVGLIKGSSGFIELAIRGDSLAGQYEINIEDDVVISYD